VQDERTAPVDDAAEELLEPGVRRRSHLVGAQHRVEAARAGLRGVLAALVLGPQELGVGGEPLVEPQVAPLGRADAVPEPLVRELVRDDALRAAAAVDRERLRLERAPQRLVGDHGAVALEGVGPEALLEERDHLGRGRELRQLGLRGIGRVVGAQRHAVRRLLDDHVELGDVDRGQVGGHRVAGLPDEGALVSVIELLDQEPVGRHDVGLGDGHLERERGLVERVVVAGEPRGGSDALGQHVHARRRLPPAHAGDEGDAGIGDRLRDAGVANVGQECVPRSDRLRGCDRQLVPVAEEGGGAVVDGDALDLEAVQLQVEGRQ
jgi:hypothetical protein